MSMLSSASSILHTPQDAGAGRPSSAGFILTNDLPRRLEQVHPGNVSRGNRDGKRAPLAGRAMHRQLATERRDNLAGDRQAQAGAPVLPGGRALGLCERLEQACQRFLADADAGIRHFHAHCGLTRSPLRQERHANPYAPVLRELDRVPHQVDDHLPEPVAIGVDGLRQRARVAHLKGASCAARRAAASCWPRRQPWRGGGTARDPSPSCPPRSSRGPGCR